MDSTSLPATAAAQCLWKAATGDNHWSFSPAYREEQHAAPGLENPKEHRRRCARDKSARIMKPKRGLEDDGRRSVPL